MEKEDNLWIQLNELKKYTFYELMNMAGRVYLLIRHSENVNLGYRGFVNEEKERGLVLVFNHKMNFTWDEEGISAKLVFDNVIQKCFIPSDDIVAVYSPELNSQLVIGPRTASEANENKQGSGHTQVEDSYFEKSGKEEDKGQKSKVVKVDFQKKRK